MAKAPSSLPGRISGPYPASGVPTGRSRFALGSLTLPGDVFAPEARAQALFSSSQSSHRFPCLALCVGDLEGHRGSMHHCRDAHRVVDLVLT